MEGQLAHLHLGFKTEIPWNVHQRFPPQNTSAHCDWTSHPQNLLKNQNHWQWRLSGKTWRKSLTVYSEKRVITRHITRHNMSAGAQWRDLWRLRCRRGHRHQDLRGFQQLLSQLNEPQSTQLDMVSSNHQVLDVYWCLLMFIDCESEILSDMYVFFDDTGMICSQPQRQKKMHSFGIGDCFLGGPAVILEPKGRQQRPLGCGRIMAIYVGT